MQFESQIKGEYSHCDSFSSQKYCFQINSVPNNESQWDFLFKNDTNAEEQIKNQKEEIQILENNLLKQSYYQNPKKEDEYFKNQDIDIKQKQQLQQSKISELSTFRNQFTNKINLFQSNLKFKQQLPIDQNQLALMFELKGSQLCETTLKLSQNIKKCFHWYFILLYNEIRSTLIYLQMSLRRPNTLVKIKTIIIKEFLLKLLQKQIPLLQNESKNIRITQKTRQKFKRIGIEIPPCRMNNGYLKRLFKNNKIQLQYIKFINQFLLIYINQQNRIKINNFKRNIDNLFEELKKNKNQKQENIQEKYKKFVILKWKQMKKPWSYREKIEIIDEAQRILKKYAKLSLQQNQSENIQK